LLFIDFWLNTVNMNILLDNKEISNYSHTDGMNILSCKLIDEVHDGVFAITTSDNRTYIKEKKTTLNNKPVVEFNIHTGSALYKNVQFVLETNKATQINFRKYPVASELVQEHVAQQQQLVTNDTPQPVKKVAQVKQQMTASKLREHIETALVGLLEDGNNRNFNKFFEVYTEGFKRDFIKISEKISRRELLRSLESGGGTNAVQYADGGTMRGTLNVVGNVNATDHLTGHVGLSSLDNEGALNGNVLKWSDADGQWAPAASASSKVVFQLGDNINTSFVVYHGMGTRDLVFQVYDNATQEVVQPHITNVSLNETQVNFSFAPTTDMYRIVIIS